MNGGCEFVCNFEIWDFALQLFHSQYKHKFECTKTYWILLISWTEKMVSHQPAWCHAIKNNIKCRSDKGRLPELLVLTIMYIYVGASGVISNSFTFTTLQRRGGPLYCKWSHLHKPKVHSGRQVHIVILARTYKHIIVRTNCAIPEPSCTRKWLAPLKRFECWLH